MNQHLAHYKPSLAAPQPSLAQWENTMRRARAAMRLGQWVVALAGCQQALVMASQLLELAPPPPGRADDCVAALVVSHHSLADLLLDVGDTDLAAEYLGRAHETLLAILHGSERDAALQQAALRHSRETHVGLLRHLAEHGGHPCITRALRAGCMAFGTGNSPLH